MAYVYNGNTWEALTTPNDVKIMIKGYFECLLNNINYTSDNLSPKEQIIYALEVLIKDIQHEIEG